MQARVLWGFAVWVVASACAPEVQSAASGSSEAAAPAAAYFETFDGEAEGFPEGTNKSLSTGVTDGAFVVTLRAAGTAHRTILPVTAGGIGLVRLEAEVDAPTDGPLYGLGCWAEEGKGGYLGVVQVTEGEAAAGIAHEDATGHWEPLELADEGPTAPVDGVHTLRMDCNRDSNGGTVTLSINGEVLAAVDVAQPPDADRTLLYTHFAGTPRGSAAEVRFHEVRVNPGAAT